jgi:YggT family protein
LQPVKDEAREARGAVRLCRRRPPFPEAAKPLFIPRNARMATMIVGNPFLWLIHTLIWIYIYILIATAVLSWLVAFNVVNMRNDIVRSISYFLYQITEPALRPIRALLPNLGGIDISPVILIIGLMFLEQLIDWIYVNLFLAS